ncbi:MAG: hypothetical protein OEM04_10790, partial [Flavobacteriaceae bacterium]|nr:hypothetical protein [Flavobacteriaceae bacterium]
MNKNLVFAILVITSFKFYGQKLLFETDIALKSVYFDDKRESLPIINYSTNEIAMFLLDKKRINGFLFDNEYKIITNYSSNKPDKKYSILLGYSNYLNEYHLFFTNENKNKFITKSFDFTSSRSYTKSHDFKLKGEVYLETISYKNKFYLLTLKKMSSILKIYEFEGNKISRTEEIDLTSYKFSNSTRSKLFDVLDQSVPFKMILSIQKMDNRNPNPLDLTANINKIYCYNDKLFITLDRDIEDTKLISIDLANFRNTFHTYSKGKIACDDFVNTKSNSYLADNLLYQIIGCKHELYFSVLNLTSDILIKEFRVKRDDQITFRNTPLTEVGSSSIFTNSKEKELENTKQLLRKIASSHIGITAYESQENFEITVGGVKGTSGGDGGGGGGSGGMMMTSPGMSISSSHGNFNIAPTYNYNTTMYGYRNYRNTRATYFKTLVEKNNFNRINGDILDNAFDKIKKFEDQYENDLYSTTIFRIDDYYVFGHYDKKEKKYYLRKF